MDELQRLSQLEGLEVDIDVRLAALWKEAFEVEDEDWTLKTIAAFMRAAYGAGYMDALKEYDAGERAKLNKEHGYKA